MDGDEDGDVVATRCNWLDREAIRNLLRRGSVHFVVAEIGRQLRWIPAAERFGFWKGDAAVHLAECKRIDLDAFPDGMAYIASEWAGSPDGVPIVLLETLH